MTAPPALLDAGEWVDDPELGLIYRPAGWDAEAELADGLADGSDPGHRPAEVRFSLTDVHRKARLLLAEVTAGSIAHIFDTRANPPVYITTIGGTRMDVPPAWEG